MHKGRRKPRKKQFPFQPVLTKSKPHNPEEKNMQFYLVKNTKMENTECKNLS